jgi:arginyl-tRNA synthetase
VRARLDQLFHQALEDLAADEAFGALTGLATGLERTRDSQHGDFTSNVAMRAASLLRQPPRELAARIVAALPPIDGVAAIEVAGPGFINFRLAPGALREALRALLADGDRYGLAMPASRARVLIEYVSANPTGPLHVGHGRHAAYGATLAGILRAAGYSVDEEYYVNDAGRQMEILAASVWLRYAALCGSDIVFPPNGYQGDYVRDIATQLKDAHGELLLGRTEGADLPAALLGKAEDPADDESRLDTLIAAIKAGIGGNAFQGVLDVALEAVLGDIRQDLQEFGAAPTNWFSERSLATSGAIDAALNRLKQAGHLFEKDGATWFGSTHFGDDKDRVVVRENGIRTYFASDIAYHLNKCERGYALLLNVLGSDHHGYIARLKAGIEAFGSDRDRLEVQLVQFVVLYRGAVKAQMSTRSGEYVTLRDLRSEVGNDAARFFYVSRSNDQHLEFDLELAKSQTNDNPVYYVQYAHARIVSVLNRFDAEGHERPAAESVPLAALCSDEELELLRNLNRYPEVVLLAAENRAPQHVVHYLRELAAGFHSWYNSERVLVDDAEARNARCLLALGTQQVLKNGLGLLGVSAPVSM